MDAPSPTKTEALLQLARQGPVRARDLDDVGIPRTYLRRLSERGILERIDRGLYRLVELPQTELSALAEVAVRVPHATICLLSALQFHGMTTEVPHAVWILIDRKARSPRVASLPLEIVRASGRARTDGVELHTLEGISVRITDPAKTVADCFRFRSHVGLETALEALKDYLEARRGTVDALLAASKSARISRLMRPYVEALV